MARFTAADCAAQGHSPSDHIDPGEVQREPVPGAEVQPYGDQRSYPGQLLDARTGPVDHACRGVWHPAGAHADGHEVYRCDSGRHWLIGPDKAEPEPEAWRAHHPHEHTSGYLAHDHEAGS